MLSEHEYRTIQNKLDHIPSTYNAQQRQNLRTTLRKKLHEHELASTYPPFQPLPYELFFINYKTPELTLLRLIETVSASNTFILDTESVGEHQKPNKPALIQLEIILPTTYSYVILIEVCHLPDTHEPTFELIQRFFNTLFHSTNTIYIWGPTEEVNKFVPFNLFSIDQLRLSNNINFQDRFKTNWNKRHQHQHKLSSSIDLPPCMCESCLNIHPNNPWSLQNAVACELNRWLDKSITRSSFDIGLDISSYHYNSKEINDREEMIRYAVNDCLSIHQLLNQLNVINNQQHLLIEHNEITSVNTQAHADEQERVGEREADYQLNMISSDAGIESSSQPQPLSNEEKRKIHNRSCTLKQRQRNYRHEIIHRDIDRRFTITNIKDILPERNIKFTLINTSISKRTGKTSLYIGIEDPMKLPEYEHDIRNFFTTDHYYQLSREHKPSSLHSRRHH